jgi:hypothetical protein
MLAFDGAVLVRHAGVVAGRGHPVMGTQRLVADCLVGAGVIVWDCPALVDTLTLSSEVFPYAQESSPVFT